MNNSSSMFRISSAYYDRYRVNTLVEDYLTRQILTRPNSGSTKGARRDLTKNNIILMERAALHNSSNIQTQKYRYQYYRKLIILLVSKQHRAPQQEDPSNPMLRTSQVYARQGSGPDYPTNRMFQVYAGQGPMEEAYKVRGTLICRDNGKFDD